MYQLRRGSSRNPRTHALSLLSIRLFSAWPRRKIFFLEARKIVASNSFLPPPSHNTFLDFKNFPYLQNHTSTSSFSVPTSLSTISNLPSIASPASYNYFQHLDHDDSKDPFFPNPPISYAKKTAASETHSEITDCFGPPQGNHPFIK